MKKFAIALLAASLLSGCYSQMIYADQPDDGVVAMTKNPDLRSVPIQRFQREERATYILNGLLTVSQPNVSSIVKQESLGKSVQNLTVRSEQTVTDLILTYSPMVASVAAGYALYQANNPATANPMMLFPAVLGVLLTFPQYRTVTVEGEVLAREKKQPVEKKPSGGNNYID